MGHALDDLDPHTPDEPVAVFGHLCAPSGSLGEEVADEGAHLIDEFVEGRR